MNQSTGTGVINEKQTCDEREAGKYENMEARRRRLAELTVTELHKCSKRTAGTTRSTGYCSSTRDATKSERQPEQTRNRKAKAYYLVCKGLKGRLYGVSEAG